MRTDLINLVMCALDAKDMRYTVVPLPGGVTLRVHGRGSIEIVNSYVDVMADRGLRDLVSEVVGDDGTVVNV